MALWRDVAYGAAALATAPVWGWAMLRTGKWRTDWAGRFGHTPLEPQERATLLIHAVSVGEVNAIRTLVDRLEEQHGEALRIVVSTTTNTGTERAKALFEGRHEVVRFPLDFSRCVRRLLDRVRPDVAALVELEVWPNFMEQCERRGIAVCVVNGRLSERSHGRYRWVRPLVRSSFAALRAVGAQDEAIAERFVDLGTPAERVRVTGTMKWDTAVLADDVEGSAALAAAMGIDRDRPVIVAGSTGPGEEKMLAEVTAGLGAQLLVAPRKPERFDEAAAALGEAVRRTRQSDGAAPPDGQRERFLLDTLGELRKAYALADVVFVGRTFCSLGGSDMIEPIGLGRATIVGPDVRNFAAAVEALLAGEGIVQVSTEGELRETIAGLLGDAARRAAVAERGRAVIRQQQGATARHAAMIGELLHTQRGGAGEPTELIAER